MLKALTTLVKNFPKQMAPHLTEILPHMWKTLTQSADHYVRTVVNYTDDADDPIDSDGKYLLNKSNNADCLFHHPSPLLKFKDVISKICLFCWL